MQKLKQTNNRKMEQQRSINKFSENTPSSYPSQEMFIPLKNGTRMKVVEMFLFPKDIAIKKDATAQIVRNFLKSPENLCIIGIPLKDRKTIYYLQMSSITKKNIFSSKICAAIHYPETLHFSDFKEAHRDVIKKANMILYYFEGRLKNDFISFAKAINPTIQLFDLLMDIGEKFYSVSGKYPTQQMAKVMSDHSYIEYHSIKKDNLTFSTISNLETIAKWKTEKIQFATLVNINETDLTSIEKKYYLNIRRSFHSEWRKVPKEFINGEKKFTSYHYFSPDTTDGLYYRILK